MDKNNKSDYKIFLWKFYILHDGSKRSHPGLVIWKDDEKNIYIAAKFGTSSSKDNLLLKRQISNAKKNYIYKRLFVGKRKDFFDKNIKDFFITNEVIKIIDKIKINNFKFSKNISKKHKKFIEYYKFIIIKEIKK